MHDLLGSLQQLAQAHGVHTAFHDLHGHYHSASPDTLRALLGAVGVDVSTDALIAEALAEHLAGHDTRILPQEHIAFVQRPDTIPLKSQCDWALCHENGEDIAEGRAEEAIALPALDVGYYMLTARNGTHSDQHCRVLVRPDRAPDLQTQSGRAACWGMTGALYGLRSAQNGGLGNYTDLANACTAIGQAGAQFFGINPVHALGWAAGDMISPYSPTHRGFLNIDHIATQAGLGPTPDDPFIDYHGFRKTHRAQLEQEYATFRKTAPHREFDAWCSAQGAALNQFKEFAQFEALSERHGNDFRKWPFDLQTPGAKTRDAAGPRAAFHLWLQWRAETQLATAQDTARASGMSLGLYLDLAVGPRPGGAEVWMNQATIAKGVTIGAPPDHLSPEGQSWALAAHAPGPMAAEFYRPLREMLGNLMAHCGLLRIDHALGLLRSFWLPDDGSPGGYISQPIDALLAVIAIEAHRSGCVIVGEDLGLVPDGFREKMNAAGLYSYSVWQFETDHTGQVRPTDTLSSQSLACFGTHDTPTLNGFWYGHDIEWWQQVGWLSTEGTIGRHEDRARQRNSLRQLCDIGPMASATAIRGAVQHTLAEAPCAMLAVQLDDALGLMEAQNLPGTIDEHPNWRRRLPVCVEDLSTRPELTGLAQTMTPTRNMKADPAKSDQS